MSDIKTLIGLLFDLSDTIEGADGDNGFLISKAADTLEQLERENAALKQALDAQMKYQRDLRADRDRLDYILSDDGGFFVWWNYDIEEWTPELKATRDWIDAARESDDVRKAKR